MQTPTLSIRLFGTLDVRYSDRLLSPLASARIETLLAYLVLQEIRPSRDNIWPSCSGLIPAKLKHVQISGMSSMTCGERSRTLITFWKSRSARCIDAGTVAIAEFFAPETIGQIIARIETNLA